MNFRSVNKNEPVMHGAIAMASVNMFMISRLSTEAPLINASNIIIFSCGVVASIICALVTSNIFQRIAKRGSTNAVFLGTGAGAAIGASVFLLLTEIVKQFQQ
jgi:hypothetical protein